MGGHATLSSTGYCTSLKEDLKSTAAELVYGTSLCLPGELYVSHDISNTDPVSYVSCLKQHMQVLHCTPPRKSSQSTTSVGHSIQHLMYSSDTTQLRSHYNNCMMDPTKSWTGLQSSSRWTSKVIPFNSSLVPRHIWWV